MKTKPLVLHDRKKSVCINEVRPGLDIIIPTGECGKIYGAICFSDDSRQWIAIANDQKKTSEELEELLKWDSFYGCDFHVISVNFEDKK